MYICQHHQFDYFCLSMAFSPNMPLISQCRPKNVKKSISIPFDHGICFIFCHFKSLFLSSYESNWMGISSIWAYDRNHFVKCRCHQSKGINNINNIR